jgi:dihydroxyacetone kinase
MAYLYDDPAEFKDDMVAGFAAAYARHVERVPGASGVMRRGGPRPGKVSVVIGGGSGHYPAFCGLVGRGLADGAVVGDVFTSPSAEQAYRVGRALDGGAGVLFGYGNYQGDVINFGAAQERLRAAGVDARTVLVTDDVASAGPGEVHRRRGIAGDFTVFKTAGAAADRGAPMDEVERLARLANDRTRTLGVAFDGCTVPGQGERLFTVAEGAMELGLGIHGERGIRTLDRLPARELAPLLTGPLLAEAPPGASGRVAAILNGLGGAKYEELFVLWRAVEPLLRAAGLVLVEPEVGELVTSLDMAGVSLTLCWLDDELEPLWRAPADTPGFRRAERWEEAPAQAAQGEEAHAGPPEPADPPGPAELTDPPEPAESRAVGRAAARALHAMRAAVAADEAELGRIDAVAGDGDHGTGMVRGLTAAVAAADAAVAAGAGPAAVLSAAGAAWSDRAGGTSGVLWGALLGAVADVLRERGPSPEALVAGLRAGASAVARLGGAHVGDKTMLDALVPFVSALEERVVPGVAWPGLAPVAGDAAEAATAAAAATAGLRPRVGRARPLAERSLGTPDAGATSLALCATAACAALTGEASSNRPPAGAPADETSANQVPAHKIPAPETRPGAASADQPPAGAAPAPAPEPPAHESSPSAAPSGQIPSDQAPADQAPADQTPAGQTPTGEPA